jgi:isopenicillin-N N-acyltransferase-like protein
MENRNALPVVECGGDDYDVGRQYGEQARDDLARCVTFLLAGIEQVAPGVGRDGVLARARRYLDGVRAFDPGAIERIRGMSDGARISFDEVFALQCSTELLVNYPALGGMCTSFAVTCPATRDGGTILGQNIDWRPGSIVHVVRIRRADGVRVLGIVLNGYGSVYLTSDGVGNCANMTLCPPAPVKGHVPFAVYLYAAMRGRTAREAMEVLRRTARGVGYVHVADGSGDMAGLESVYDDCAIVDPHDGVLVHANHYETERYRKLDLAPVHIPHSFRRAARLRELVTGSHGSLTPEAMRTFLSDHRGRPHSVCAHVDRASPAPFPAESIASVIMVLDEGRMLVAAGTPCDREYAEYRV